jgi:methionyl-tRNA formyltransferase
LKILILTPEIHFHAPFILKELFSHFSGKDKEFQVILTPKISAKKSLAEGIGTILKKSGLAYFVMMVIMKFKFDLYSLLEKLVGRDMKDRKYPRAKEVCDFYKVPVFSLKSINSPEAAEIIKKFEPDITLVLFFNQILKPEVIALSKTCINLHPSYIPEYRGMSPILWMLAEGAEQGGVTVHHINEKIDSGNIVARARFDIKPHDSFFKVYRQAAIEGARLLEELFELDEFPPGTPQGDGEKKFYSSFTKEALKSFCKQHSFLKF